MTIKEMRLLLQVSRTEFSRQYHIPLRTRADLCSGKMNSPNYVMELLKRV